VAGARNLSDDRPRTLKMVIAAMGVALLAIIVLPKKVEHRWEIKFMVAQVRFHLFILISSCSYMASPCSAHLDDTLWYTGLGSCGKYS
jgi:hypothetical protein